MEWVGVTANGWRRGVVVSLVGLINEINSTWMSDRLRTGIPSEVHVCNQPTRSTQPSIPPGSVKRGPASAGKPKARFMQFADKCVGVQVTSRT